MTGDGGAYSTAVYVSNLWPPGSSSCCCLAVWPTTKPSSYFSALCAAEAINSLSLLFSLAVLNALLGMASGTTQTLCLMQRLNSPFDLFLHMAFYRASGMAVGKLVGRRAYAGANGGHFVEVKGCTKLLSMQRWRLLGENIIKYCKKVRRRVPKARRGVAEACWRHFSPGCRGLALTSHI